MAKGRALVQYAAEGELEGFKKLFLEEGVEMQNLMFWHIQKALKEAIKYKQLFIIEYIIIELEMKLDHPCFQGFFHKFLYSCCEADESKDEDEQEINRQIVRYMCKAAGKESIDFMDSMGSNTVLHLACELLKDFTIVETIVSTGADVNPVNNDDQLPLAIIKRRLETEDPESYDLQDIYELLQKKGATLTWR